MNFNMPPFYTMEMMRLAAELTSQGKSLDHLEVGQPIFTAPPLVVEAAKSALSRQTLQYCSALGVYELRQAIATHYKTTYDLDIPPEAVVITPGSSLGLYIALLMNFKPGARIAIASPSYPCYRNVIRSLNFDLIEIPTFQEEGYLITPQSLESISSRIDGLLIASPNNPTGSMYDVTSLKELAEYCPARGIKILSDELYHGITYEFAAETVLKFNSDAIVISGFSKYFAMTGWRVGWMIIDPADASRYECLLQNMILCTSPLPQVAAVQAFADYALLDGYVKQYKVSRDALYSILVEAGFDKLYKPQGAYYIYLELEGVSADSLSVCKQLLIEENVATAPGLDFSSNPTHCALRLSFSQPKSVIENAGPKLIRFLSKLTNAAYRRVA